MGFFVMILCKLFWLYVCDICWFWFVKVYPKVKVRDEAQDVDEDDYATRFCKALDALSLHNFPSPPGDLSF